MIANIIVEEQVSYHWEKVAEYSDVEFRTFHNDNIYIGSTVTFDIENGDDWSKHEKGLDRHIMEGTDTLLVFLPTLMFQGFASVLKYGPNNQDGDDPPKSYVKQRWIVTERK